MVSDRSRVFAFELYPESAPDEWIKLLEGLHIPTAISPLHDKDKDEDGKFKKAHWHIVFYFDGKKTVSQVLQYLAPLGVKHVEAINNTRSYNRYLCHLDNPDKAQYDRADIVLLNGARPDFSIPLTSEDVARIRKEIVDWIEEYSIVEYAELVLYASHERPDDWLEYVAHNTIFLNGFIRSIRHTMRSRDGGSEN